jgi:hypothetical protein
VFKSVALDVGVFRLLFSAVPPVKASLVADKNPLIPSDPVSLLVSMAVPIVNALALVLGSEVAMMPVFGVSSVNSTGARGTVPS